LEVPPFVVDANIHPKKLEVKLQREGNIRELFRELFKGHKTHIPSLNQERHPYKAEPELLGILEDTILIVNWMESLYFIDQHLLAERINYEKGQTSDKACKGAIKAGDKLSPAQVRAMLKEWVGLQNPHTCPHGRPIYYRLPLKEIYQQIGRDR
jgi:DNA mismatch repair protein MutL